jgi:Fic-DOC domain mobile mystery protein B
MTATPVVFADAPLTADERAALLPSLSTRAQLLEIESLGIQRARIWAMRAQNLARTDLLTEGFCGELHRRMFGGVWRRAGKYREAGFAGWEPGRIAEGMRLFLDDADGWLKYSTYTARETAVRLHHRLAAVRPWTRGNGRHARLLADVIVASQAEPPLTWGSRSPDPSAGRHRYVEAMRAADGGDFVPLLDFAGS